MSVGHLEANEEEILIVVAVFGVVTERIKLPTIAVVHGSLIIILDLEQSGAIRCATAIGTAIHLDEEPDPVSIGISDDRKGHLPSQIVLPPTRNSSLCLTVSVDRREGTKRKIAGDCDPCCESESLAL